jgi:microcompartment protein CcmL/EutN
MKKYPAIAIIEFKDIAVGIYSTDAMLKRAPISLVKSGIISRGRYLTLICGTTASVEESFSEGLITGGDNVLDQVILADVHPQVHDAVLGHRNPVSTGAIGIIETPTASSNVRAAELALKGTPVNLIEMRLADTSLSGKGVSIYRGELPDIEAAVDMIVSYLKQARIEFVDKIIPSPHEAMSKQLESSTYFYESNMITLDGGEG